MKMSWEYLAGFFDGEGTICFASYSYRNNPSRYVTIAVSQADFQAEVIYEIKDFLDNKGISYRLSKDIRRSIRRPGFQIRLYMNGMANSKEFILNIFPFLRVKRNKAIEALSFIDQNLKGLSLTINQKKEILELRSNGVSVINIAKKFGKSTHPIYSLIKKEKYGIKAMVS